MALNDRNTVLLVPFNDGDPDESSPTDIYSSRVSATTPTGVIVTSGQTTSTDEDTLAAVNFYDTGSPYSDRHVYRIRESPTPSNNVLITYSNVLPVAGGPFTLECWIKITNTGTWTLDLFWQQSILNLFYFKVSNDGTLTVTHSKSGSSEDKTFGTIATGSWVFLQLEYDGADTYTVNGTSQTFTSKTFTQSDWDPGSTFTFTATNTATTSADDIFVSGLKVSTINRYSSSSTYPDQSDVWAGESTTRDRSLRDDIYSDYPSSRSEFICSLDFNGATFEDSSSEANVITENNMTYSSDRISKDYSAVFNGTDSTIDIASNTLFNAFYLKASPWTISCWVKFNTASGTQTIFSSNPFPGTHIDCKFDLTGNALDIDAVGVSLTGSHTFVADQWYHVALVKHYANAPISALLMCFIDGVLIDSAAVTDNSVVTGTDFVLGADISDGNKLDGQMDNLRISSDTRYWQDFYVSNYTQNTRVITPFKTDLVPHPVALHDTDFPQNIPDFTRGLNSVYIAGISPMRKVFNGDFFDMGFTTPPDLADANGSGSGTLDGTYAYVWTLLDEYGNESGPSNYIEVVVSNASTITLEWGSGVGLFVGKPDRIRIYRKHTSIGETEYFLVEEVQKILPQDQIPANMTAFWQYKDTTEDIDVSSIIIAPDQGTTAPPVCNFIEFVPETGSMFYGAPEDEPTKVWYSDVNQAERVGANSFFFVGNDDSDWITGMKVLGGQLVVVKERSTYTVLGSGTNTSVEQRSGQIGCVSHESIVAVGDFLFWAGDEGIYGFDGRSPVNISVDIDEIFNDMPDERKPFIKGAYDSENGYLLFAMSRTSTTDNDTMLCFNYRDWSRDPEKMELWTVWTLTGDDLTEGVMGTGRNPRVYIADTDSNILRVEGTDDDGTGIEFDVTFGERNMLRPGMEQHVHDLTFIARTTGTEALSFGYEHLGSDVMTDIDSYTTLMDRALIGCDRRVHFLPLRFKSKTSVTTEVALYGVSVRGSQIGFR